MVASEIMVPLNKLSFSLIIFLSMVGFFALDEIFWQIIIFY